MAIFTDVLLDVTKNGRKLPTNEYKEFGLHPIIDQGQNDIAGYTDETSGLFSDVPAIIFGDHTRVIKYVDAPFFVGADGVKILKAKDNKANYKFLYYALSSAKIPNTGYNRHFKWLKEIDIPTYSEQEQSQIVSELDKVIDLIGLRTKQLEKLDLLVKSRFIELFGDPNLNDKGWLMGVINDIGACVAGATPSTQVKEYWENGTIPWMSSGEVNKGRVFETDTKITQLGYDNASTKLVPPKTVVLAMAGQGRTRGTAAITEIELCTNQSICSIVNNEKVHAEYLLYFLKLQYMELRGASTNTDGRGGLNLKIIGNYPIMIPPMALQEQFAAFVEQTDKSKLAVQQSLKKLETLKKSLMQQYFE